MPMQPQQPLFGASPESVTRKRRMAEQLMGEGMSTAPVGHWSQALARVLQAGVGGYGMHRAEQQETAGKAGASQAMIDALMNKDMTDAGLAEAMGNQWMSPGQSSVLGGLLKDRIDKRNPNWKYFESQGDQYRLNENATGTATPERVFDAPTEQKWQKLDDRTLYDDATGATKDVSGGVPAAPDFDNQLSLTKTVRSEPGVSRFSQLEPYLGSMQQSLSDPRAIMDNDFIYGTALAMSPDGRVTDQDFQAAADAQGWGAALRGEVAKALRGQGKLTKETRQAMYELTRRRAEHFRAQGERELGFYEGIAKPGGYQLPELGQLPEYTPEQSPAPEFDDPTTIPEGATVEDDNGQRFIKKGGQLVPVQ